VKRGSAFVVGFELRDRHRLAFAPEVSDVVRGQHDGRERRRSVVGEVAHHVTWLLHEDAAGRRSPDPAAAPPLSIAALDPPDAVVLLHPGMQRRGRPAHHTQTRQRDGKLDEALHRLSVAP
jgi:hypothetical protein